MQLGETIRRRNLVLALTFLGLAGCMAVIRGVGWTSGSALHTTMEVGSTLLAIWIGTLSLVRYYSKKLTPFLVLGVGFLGTAVLDAYHVLVTSDWFAASMPSAPASVIGWSWMTSRMFQAVVVCIAYTAWQREQRLGAAGRLDERRYYWLVGLLVAVSFIVVGTLPMPPAYGAGVFHRTAEFLPAMLFLAAFAGHYRKQFHQLNGFDFWLMLSMLFSFAAHAMFMSLSERPFDAMFDTAHVLKAISYGVVLWGLLMSVYATYRRVDSAAAEMGELNPQLRVEVSERQQREQELRLAKEQAEAASQAKSQFLANMSHELRTPLNSVIGFANILRKNKSGGLGDKDLYYLERIQDNGKHLLGLINDVLDLSKIEAGKLEVELSQVNLSDLIPQVLSQFESLVRESGVELRTDVPPDIQPLESDEGKLKQVLVNLIGNAVKFTHEGSVTVRLVADPVTGEAMRVDVIDTGIGILEDKLGAVFESFNQVESGTDRSYEGTGLGLAISRSMCHLLGLELVADARFGSGSTFSILLREDVPEPCHGEELIHLAEVFSLDSRRATDNPQDLDRPDLLGRLVLIVDDNRDCQILHRHYAEETGCRVIICGSGQEALELARRHDPDLLLLDLMMPEMDGWEVLRQFKADPQLRGIPVVVISIVGRENQAQLREAAAVINKPFEPEELFAVLTRHLDHDMGDGSSELLRMGSGG